MLVTSIEVYNRRTVRTRDVKGAFLILDQDDFVVVRFIEEQVYSFYEIDSKYKEFLYYECRVKVLYVMLSKLI